MAGSCEYGWLNAQRADGRCARDTMVMMTPIGIGDEHLLACLMLLFNGQWNIFNKQVPQATA